ncbi:hypothetical protein ACT3CE_13690 [Marinifilum sp. RC60d5]|uniref:hypothetical protein n=1 Tax=Marinifilum sp. RC60d5 TaxID=3458414 RepID=UPI004035857A
MTTTNLLSKLTNSDKPEIVIGINQALECIGVNNDLHNLSRYQAKEVGRVLVEKFADLIDLESVAKSIKETISGEELENFKHEIVVKLKDKTASATKTPIYRKRMDTLKSCFEEISGDSVL